MRNNKFFWILFSIVILFTVNPVIGYNFSSINSYFNVSWQAPYTYQDNSSTINITTNTSVRVFRDVASDWYNITYGGGEPPSSIYDIPKYYDSEGGYVHFPNVINTVYLKNGFPAISQPYEVYAVLRVLDGPSDEGYMSYFFGIRDRGNDHYEMNGVEFPNGSGVAVKNQITIIRMRIDGNESYLWLNNVTYGNGSALNISTAAITGIGYSTVSHVADQDFFGLWFKFGNLSQAEHDEIYSSLAGNYSPGIYPSYPFADNITYSWNNTQKSLTADYDYLNTLGLPENTSRVEYQWYTFIGELDNVTILNGTNATGQTLIRSNYRNIFGVNTTSHWIKCGIKVYDNESNTWREIQGPWTQNNIEGAYTCSNGVQDGDETGLNCGGSCSIDCSPEWITEPSNFSILINETISKQYVASDQDNVSNYSLNDNTNFTINATGYFTNATNLTVTNYTVNITVLDIYGNNRSKVINIQINNTPQYVTINSPNTLYYNTSNITFNITLNKTGIGFFNLNNGTNNTMSTADNIIFTYVNSSISDGIYIAYFYGNDSYGEIGTNQTQFIVDTTSPLISYSNGTDSSVSYVSRNYVLINVTANDTNIANITIRIYNLTSLINSTNVSSESIINFTLQGDGTYYYNASVYDLAGNSNTTETRNITIDTILPTIGYLINGTEQDGSYINREYLTINISGNDTNIANITLYIHNSSNILVHTNTTTANTLYVLYNTTLQGIYYYNSTIYDLAGNYNNSETRNVTVDTINPNITINSPANNYTFNTSSISINITISDLYISNTTIILYNITNSIINTTTYNTNTEIIYTPNLTDGIYIYNITTRDLAGNANNTIQNFTIDTTIPSVIINNPSQNYIFNTSNITINISLTEVNILNTSIEVYNSSGINLNITNYTTETNILYSINLTDGNYNYTILTFDFANNFNRTLGNFSIDTINPSINYSVNNTETNAIYVNRTYIQINVTANDTNTINTTIRIYNSSGTLINYSVAITEQIFLNYTASIDGTYYYNASVYDLAGNSNTTETRNITIDTTNPEVTITSPSQNYIFNTSTVTINLTVSDSNLANTTIRIYNTTNNSINNTLYQANTSISFIISLTNSTYNYNITTVDLAGNINLTSRIFIVNITSSSGGSSGGSGGGGGSGSSSSTSSATTSTTTPTYLDEIKYSKFWFTLVKGLRKVDIVKDKMPVSQVIINVTENKDTINQNLVIISTIENPSKTLDAKIYRYLIFDANIGYENYAQITMKLKVENTWLLDNNLSENNLTIYKEVNGIWKKIDSNIDLTNNDTNYTYYTISAENKEMLAIGTPLIPKIVSEVKKEIVEENASNTKDINSEGDKEEIQTTENTVNTKTQSVFFEKTNKLISSTWNKSSEYIRSIPRQTQILIGLLMCSTMLLLILSVGGTILYNNITNSKNNKSWLRKYTKHGSITSYEVEPPTKTGIITIKQTPPTDKIIETPKNNDTIGKTLSTPELIINKIEELLQQASYSLNNGKLEDAKKYYTDAKSIYFNSNISYEYKAKVYDKIMKLHTIIYGK